MSAARTSTAQSRIYSGILAHLYAQGVTVLTQLASLPIFLSRWDLNTYGRWLMLMTLPAYLSISDVGLLTASGNLMAMHQARRETHEVNRIYNSSLAAMLLLVPALSLLSGLLLWLFSFGMSVDERRALFVLIVAGLITVLCSVFEASYRPFGKYPRITVMLTTARIVEWSGSIAGLFMGGTLTSAGLGYLIGRAGCCAALFVIAPHDTPELHYRLRLADWGLIRSLLRYGFGFLSFPVGNVVTLQGTVLLVGSQLGGSALTLFSSTRTLTRMLTQIATISAKSMAPEISALYGAGNEPGAAELCRRMLWKIVPLTLLGAAVLLPLGPTILRVWSRGKLSMNMTCYALLLGAAVASAWWQILAVRLTATNRHALLAIIFMLIALIALPVTALTETRFGIDATSAVACGIDALMIVGTIFALGRARQQWSGAYAPTA